jgi:hypothetical protein
MSLTRRVRDERFHAAKALGERNHPKMLKKRRYPE